MLSKLDDFCTSSCKASYKVSTTLDNWVVRTDSVTVYLYEPLTPEAQAKLIEITAPHVRNEPNLDQPGEKIAQGIYKGINPTKAQTIELIKQAHLKDPRLGAAVFGEANSSHLLSAGQYHASQQMLSEFDRLTAAETVPHVPKWPSLFNENLSRQVVLPALKYLVFTAGQSSNPAEIEAIRGATLEVVRGLKTNPDLQKAQKLIKQSSQMLADTTTPLNEVQKKVLNTLVTSTTKLLQTPQYIKLAEASSTADNLLQSARGNPNDAVIKRETLAVVEKLKRSNDPAAIEAMQRECAQRLDDSIVAYNPLQKKILQTLEFHSREMLPPGALQQATMVDVQKSPAKVIPASSGGGIGGEAKVDHIIGATNNRTAPAENQGASPAKPGSSEPTAGAWEKNPEMLTRFQSKYGAEGSAGISDLRVKGTPGDLTIALRFNGEVSTAQIAGRLAVKPEDLTDSAVRNGQTRVFVRQMQLRVGQGNIRRDYGTPPPSPAGQEGAPAAKVPGETPPVNYGVHAQELPASVVPAPEIHAPEVHAPEFHAPEIHGRGGVIGAVVVGTIVTGAALLNGASPAQAAETGGRTIIDGAVPGAAEGFTNLTQKQSGLDRVLNWADTVTATTATAAGATTVVTAPLALTGWGAVVPVAAGITAAAATGANVAVGLVSDGLTYAGLTKRGGIIHSAVDLGESYETGVHRQLGQGNAPAALASSQPPNPMPPATLATGRSAMRRTAIIAPLPQPQENPAANNVAASTIAQVKQQPAHALFRHAITPA